MKSERQVPKKRTPRKPKTAPPFSQIATGTFERVSTVFGLDREGRVWVFLISEERFGWAQIDDAQAPPLRR